ncbi:MAG: hypothetical protein WKG07_36010 [Hymenobacter sp.]
MNPTWDVLRAADHRARGWPRRRARPPPARPPSRYSRPGTSARAGDNIVSVPQLYGGTYNLFAHTLPQYGIEVRFLDARPSRAAGRARR